jgi:hypothetical protein
MAKRKWWRFAGIIPRRVWHGAKHAWYEMTGYKDVFIHHSAGIVPRTYAESKVTLDGIDTLHHSKGWAGAGYNHAADVDGRKWALRGWRFIGAHNEDENSSSYGIVALGNFAIPPVPKAKVDRTHYSREELNQLVEAIIEIIKEGQARKKGPRIRKHPRVRAHGIIHGGTDATACPGEYLARHLPEIRAAVKGTA